MSIANLDVLRKMFHAFPWIRLTTKQMQYQRTLLVRLERIVQGCRGFVWAIPFSLLVSCGLMAWSKGFLGLSLVMGVVSGYIWHQLWRTYGKTMTSLEGYHQALLQGVDQKIQETCIPILFHIRLSVSFRSPWLEFHVYQPWSFLLGFVCGYVFFRFLCVSCLDVFLHRPLAYPLTFRQDLSEIFVLGVVVYGVLLGTSVVCQLVCRRTSGKS